MGMCSTSEPTTSKVDPEPLTSTRGVNGVLPCAQATSSQHGAHALRNRQWGSGFSCRALLTIPLRLRVTIRTMRHRSDVNPWAMAASA